MPVYFITIIMEYPVGANFGTSKSILSLSYHFAAYFKVADQRSYGKIIARENSYEESKGKT